VATSYNEIENLKLALYFVLKLSVTTGFIFGPIVVYAVSKLAKAARGPAPDLCWNLGRDGETGNERRRAA
jgi:hypothetical protein